MIGGCLEKAHWPRTVPIRGHFWHQTLKLIPDTYCLGVGTVRSNASIIRRMHPPCWVRQENIFGVPVKRLRVQIKQKYLCWHLDLAHILIHSLTLWKVHNPHSLSPWIMRIGQRTTPRSQCQYPPIRHCWETTVNSFRIPEERKDHPLAGWRKSTGFFLQASVSLVPIGWSLWRQLSAQMTSQWISPARDDVTTSRDYSSDVTDVWNGKLCKYHTANW